MNTPVNKEDITFKEITSIINLRLSNRSTRTPDIAPKKIMGINRHAVISPKSVGEFVSSRTNQPSNNISIKRAKELRMVVIHNSLKLRYEKTFKKASITDTRSFVISLLIYMN